MTFLDDSFSYKLCQQALSSGEKNLLENTELTTKINFKILHKILVTLYKCFLGFIFVAVAATRISHLAF